ncbi:VOC family protein [Mesorhizobium sp. M1006]|uniref:VOC family protein n=1 Tax=Mesorhizobium sp. M1006 TaxID=2957048 RepID=UPI00333715FD
MLNAIHPVAFIRTDYDRSRRFYVELLGLELIREVYREERQTWKANLRIGSVQFSFPAPAMRPSHPEATGLRHLAFAVANLDPVIMRLEAAGVAVEPIRIDPYTDQRFTFSATQMDCRWNSTKPHTERFAFATTSMEVGTALGRYNPPTRVRHQAPCHGLEGRPLCAAKQSLKPSRPTPEPARHVSKALL